MTNNIVYMVIYSPPGYGWQSTSRSTDSIQSGAIVVSSPLGTNSESVFYTEHAGVKLLDVRSILAPHT